MDLDDAHREAVQTMEQQLTEMARSDVLRRFDDARDIRIRTEYRDEDLQTCDDACLYDGLYI